MQLRLAAMSAVLALALGAGQALEAQPSSIHPTDVAKSGKDMHPASHRGNHLAAVLG